jgi:hypothetical protein
MFHLWKCPRCWDSPCHCEVDAFNDPVGHTGQYADSVKLWQDSKKRELELLEEQNRLLKKIAEQK